MKRRRLLLLSGLGSAGALLVGWGLLPPRGRAGQAGSLPDTEDGAIGLNGWIRIAPDGRAQLAMPRSEMGQGIHTTLAMLAAEELDLPLSRIQLVPAGHDSLYGNVALFTAALPQHPRSGIGGQPPVLARTGDWLLRKLARELGVNATGGSTSLADAWEVLRPAAATARAQLLGAASLRWRLPVDEFSVVDGVIHHPSGQSGAYSEFAKAAALTPPGEVRLKSPAQWRLLGSAAPRIDLVAKCNGTAQFGADVRLPEQCFSVVHQCPILGGSPARFNSDAALRLPGVLRVVRLGTYAGSSPGVAVVGITRWHAERGAQALDIAWNAPPQGAVDSDQITTGLVNRAREAATAHEGTVFHRHGDPAAAMDGVARRIEADYQAPYLAHLALEPINATARVADGRVEVWVPTQVPGLARALAAEVAGVPPDAVTVHVTYLGGAFGRRLDIEVVGQVVRIAMETGGRPVQLQWSREEDSGHDQHRPAAAALLQGGLDSRGQLLSLNITSAADAVTPRWTERVMPGLASRWDLPDKTTSEGLYDLPYRIPHQRIAHLATRHAVPVGYWRSVGHSHNAFFSEGFIDELATAAGRDPVLFRLDMLSDMPRHAAVLRQVAELAGWPLPGRPGSPLAPGRARGVALHQSFGSIVAQVCEVSRNAGRLRVHRVVCVADLGTVVNPGIARQQMEGAIVFGLSAALYGRVDIRKGVVQQRNFGDHPLLGLADCPQIDTAFMPSDRPPTGAGEPGVPPVAPALANALFALTGERQRRLPLTG